MDREIRTALVEISAQVAVLKFGVQALMGEMITRLSPADADAVIETLKHEAGDLPPQGDPSSVLSTMFYEEVAARAPFYAEMLAQAAALSRGSKDPAA